MTLTNQEIQNLLESFEKESKAIRQELFKLSWFMRGSVSIEQAFMLDVNDREIIGELVKENLETTKESGLPFF